MAKATGTKNRKTGAKASSRSGTAKKSPAKSSTASRKKSNIEIIDEQRLKARKQITAILLFAFSVFFLCVTIIPGESFWQVMRNVIFGMFGYCAFLWPLIMIYVSVMYAMEKTNDKIGFKLFEITALIVFICGAFYIFSGNFDNVLIWEDIKDSYTMGISHANGGVFGAIFGGILMKIFGKTGAAITDIIIICVMIMLITGTTLIKLFKTLWTPVKKIEEYSEVKVSEMMPARGKRFNIDVDLGPDDDTDVRKRKAEYDDDEITTIFDQKTKSKNRAVGKKTKKDSERETIAKIFDIEREEKKYEDHAEAVLQPQPVVQSPASGIDDIVKKAAQKSAAAKTPVPAEISSEIKAQSNKDDNSANYKFPPIDCLRKGTKSSSSIDSEELKQNASTLVSTLKSFGVETKVIDISRGPSVTRYELKPSAGVKISRITNLADDIALNLAASGVRIEAPIPNKAAVGIEIPNRNREVVTAREIIDTKLYKAIEECLKEKGMTRVSNKNEAQIIFVPLWNISEREIPTYNTPYNLNLPVQPLPIRGNPYKKAVSLEMQAWFPDMDSWVWRGFSPMEVSPLMMTSGSIRDQVDWCFKHFPPEEYPSNLEKRRDEIADKKYEEKNQFNNVLIEDRKNRDTISSERN